MPEVRVLPEDIKIIVGDGKRRDLLALLTASGVPVDSECGGKGSCGKCTIELVSGSLSDRHGDPARPVRENRYLACQSVPAGDCEIRLVEKIRDSAMVDALVAGSVGIISSATGVADRLGVAVDVGTTTVVAILADLDTGSAVAVESETNPQRAYGADVVSRIAFSYEEGDTRSNTEVLQEAVVGCVNRLVGRLCRKSGQDACRVESVVCTGNTAMQHFLLGVTPRHLGMAPYEAEFKEVEARPARTIGLDLPEGATLRVLPNIRSFIGADTVGCLLSIDGEKPGGFTLMIDMGTNTEIVLGRAESRAACSAAAGPAFEGAQLTHGMRATPGAIASVWPDGGKVRYRTVWGEPALGICGSGIVDAIATMRRLGAVDACGRMPEFTEYVLVPAARSGTGRDITVTRRDIREIQLVKASIATGIAVLLDTFGIGCGELERFYVAGAFGNYLDIDNARYIGLLPDLPSGRFEPIGDAALKGAYIGLTGGPAALERAREIAFGTDHVELAGLPDFQARFLANLDLEAYPGRDKP